MELQFESTLNQGPITIEKLMKESGVDIYTVEKTKWGDEVIAHFNANDIEYTLKMTTHEDRSQFFLLYRTLKGQFKWLLADTSNHRFVTKRISEDLEFINALNEA